MRERTADAPRALIAHPGAELYGSDRVMLETAAALIERGWDVTIALPTTGPLVAAVTALGAEVRLLPVPVVRKRAMHPIRLAGFVGASAVALIRVGSFLRDLRPDVVYVSTLTVPLWTAAARIRRIPVVAHVHESERQAPRLLRACLAFPLLLANRVVVNSAFSRTSLTEVIPVLQAQSVVVYNGVPGPPHPVPARDDLGEGLRVLYVGRLSPRKGVDVAISAIHEVRAEGVLASLDVVGDVFAGYEWYEQQLRDQVLALGLQAAVRFHGFRPEVWPALSDADVAVVPSRLEEPFGNTAVEAVLAGRPVAVSAIGGLAEAIDGVASAIPVPAGDPKALAAALLRIARAWDGFRRTATAMAPIAAERFSTDTYRRLIATEIALATGTEIPARRLPTHEDA